MLKNSRNNNLNRIIDANLNRVKEGFRVCEEITRFILNDYKFTASLKKYRHEIDSIVRKIYPVALPIAQKRAAAFPIRPGERKQSLPYRQAGMSFCPTYKLLKEREVVTDVGRKNSLHELKRANLGDIFWANIQRVKESLRVLEEFSKLENKKAALGFKQLRYKVYEIEKKSFKKISALSNLR